MLWQIRVSLTAVVALLSASLAFAQASDYDRRPRTASVSGCVTIGEKPAANVTVMVTEPQSGIIEARIFTLGGRDFVDHYFYKATTDAEGRYQIRGLPAGDYLVAPKAPAYVPESKSLGLVASVKITLDEGEARDKVDFALVRGGVITGRVTDEDGRPQVGRYVKIEQLISQDERRGVPNKDDRLLETDDRGVYRIFGLQKGRYIVWAGGEHDTLRGAIRGKRTQVTYHPDVINQAESTVIEVAEGREITGVDIKLRNPVETFTVSGRVINSETGKPLPQVNVYCFPVENQEEESGNAVAYAITDAEGNFTATGLKPGKYKAKLTQPIEGSEYNSEGKYFEVSDGDVSGVQVLARRGATINGMVIVEEGRDASDQAKLSQTGMYVDVYQEYFIGTIRNHRTVGWLRSKIGNDGGFRFFGAPPGKAIIRFRHDPSNPFHLLRVELNGVEARDGLQVGPGEEINGVRVIVGHGGGSIRGSLKIVGGILPEGVSLSAYVSREGPSHFHRSGAVDEKGRFVINGLLTGEYSLGISWGMNQNPPAGQYPKLPQAPKQRVSVTNGAETQVTLTYDLSRKEREK